MTVSASAAIEIEVDLTQAAEVESDNELFPASVFETQEKHAEKSQENGLEKELEAVEEDIEALER